MALDKIKTLSLPGANQADQVNEGEFLLAPGRILRGVVLNFVGNLNNSSASTATLTAASKLALLNIFQVLVGWGRSQRFKTFNYAKGGDIRECSREVRATEVDRYSDSTIGLGQTLNGSGTNSGNTQVTFRLYVPLGRYWKDAKSQNWFGMGVAQAKTMVIQVKRLADAGLQSNISTQGTWTVDVVPDDVPNKSKHDQLFWPPVLTPQMNVAAYNKQLDDGLYLYVVEQSAAHASTSITQLTVDVGDFRVMNAFDPQIWLDFLDDEYAFSGAPNIVDTDTVIFRQRDDQAVDDWTVGGVYMEQPARNLNPMKLMAYYFPIIDEASIEDTLQYLVDSKEVGSTTTLKGVAGHAVFRNMRSAPEKLVPFLPIALIEKGTSAYDKYPGMVASPGMGAPQIKIPKTVTSTVVNRIAGANANGASGTAELAAKSLALTIPGAVQHSKGIGFAPSKAVAAVSAHLNQSLPTKV